MRSRDQDRALRSFARFMHSDATEFSISGLAGSGKSELLLEIAGDMGDRCAVMALSARAAHVLRSRGCSDATTIHSRCYVPPISLTAACALCSREIVDGDFLFFGMQEGRMRRYAGQCCVGDLEHPRPIHEDNPDFVLRDADDPRLSGIDLFAIDESETINRQIAADLRRLGKKLLTVGDDGQLMPPGGDRGFRLGADADAILTQVHRQAANSPVLKMANRVRAGEILPTGEYGDDCQVLRRSKIKGFETSIVNYAGSNEIIITGRRDTAHAHNLLVRQALGIKSLLPVKGDKIACLENQYHREAGDLLNGSEWLVLEDAKVFRESGCVTDTCELLIAPLLDPSGDKQTVKVPSDLFLKPPHKCPVFRRKDISRFTYSFAATCHRCLGGEWDAVCIIDESQCFYPDQARWAYSALTRAKSSAVMVLP